MGTECCTLKNHQEIDKIHSASARNSAQPEHYLGGINQKNESIDSKKNKRKNQISEQKNALINTEENQQNKDKIKNSPVNGNSEKIETSANAEKKLSENKTKELFEQSDEQVKIVQQIGIQEKKDANIVKNGQTNENLLESPKRQHDQKINEIEGDLFLFSKEEQTKSKGNSQQIIQYENTSSEFDKEIHCERKICVITTKICEVKIEKQIKIQEEEQKIVQEEVYQNQNEREIDKFENAKVMLETVGDQERVNQNKPGKLNPLFLQKLQAQISSQPIEITKRELGVVVEQLNILVNIEIMNLKGERAINGKKKNQRARKDNLDF